MPRTATNQAEVLQAVVDRLIAAVPQFKPTTCFLTAQPLQEPPANLDKDLFCTVSPTNGRFDGGAHDGGGENLTIEETGVLVVIYSGMRLDRRGHDTQLLIREGRGLLDVKHWVLRSLSGHDLKNARGNSILVNQMAPLQTETPQSGQDKNLHIGDIAVAFSTDFEWDLT